MRHAPPRPIAFVIGILAVGSMLAGPAGATYPGRNGRLVFAVGGPARTRQRRHAGHRDAGRKRPAAAAGGQRSRLAARWASDRVHAPRRVTAADRDDDRGRRQRPREEDRRRSGHRRVTSYATSPTGRRIAYSMRLPHAAGDGWALYVARPDGHHPRRVLTTMGHYAYMDQLRWSPDGHTLLGVEDQAACGSSPRRAMAPACSPRPLRTIAPLTPSWSPDGREVLYAIDPGPGPPGDTAIMVVGHRRTRSAAARRRRVSARLVTRRPADRLRDQRRQADDRQPRRQ